MGVHQSAQCDRASIAQNYYYGGFKFLYPEVNEHRCIDGIVSCEMPLSAFLSAGLYKVFSYDEFYFRLLTYLFFSLGMMALFFMFLERMGHLLSMAFVLLIQMSPIVLFYCNNFLPDTTSLGLAFISWFLFFKLYIPHPWLPEFKQTRYHILFVLCLSLSVAVKTTSLIQYLSMAALLLFSYIPYLDIKIKQRKKLLQSLTFALILPVAWFFWSRHLATHHNSQYFLMNIPEYSDWAKYHEAWYIYLANWPTQTFSYPLIYIAVVLLFLTIFLKRFIQKELYAISIINTIGSIAFIVIMIEQFKYHDYYILCLFPVFALNWMALANAATKIKAKYWWIRLSLFALILITLNFQFNRGRINLEERYTEGNYWEQSHHRSVDLDSFRIQIQALGIDRNECVIAGFDPAPNNLLYLLHLRGHRLSKDHNKERLDYILNGAHPKYLISNDSTLNLEIDSMVHGSKSILKFKNLSLIELQYDSTKKNP